MAVRGRIWSRLALAIVLTALIPVTVAILLAESMVEQTGARFFLPELGTRLDQSLELYQELARAVKTSMRHQAAAIAARESLRSAALGRDRGALERELRELLGQHPNLVSLAVTDPRGIELARVSRGRPLDTRRENRLEVVKPLGVEPEGHGPKDQVEPAEAPRLEAVFATDRARFDQLEEMSQFVDTYHRIERRRRVDEASYVYAFAALLGITILAAVGVGALLARGVVRRIAELGQAAQRVGAGDLSIRVQQRGRDEIADLAAAFNRMLSEVESSRARVEYLQRIGAWQEMARRLAHEIKNPLTPIQLAVEEIHRRYSGHDEQYRKLLDSTLEMVEDEVGTLRRLVTEFSNFARLPQAELRLGDLGEFLRDQAGQLWPADDELGEGQPTQSRINLELEVVLPEGPAPAYLDRQMLRRALVNLVRNAAQAIQNAGRGHRIEVKLGREGDHFVINIDDDGPGIPPELREAAFDPYMTTKPDGTGLGLAIAKKIVVEHGGSITALSSPLGGARISVRLPAAGTAACRAALEAREWQPASTRKPGLARDIQG